MRRSSPASPIGAGLLIALIACAPTDETDEATIRDSIPPPPYSQATLPVDTPPSAGVPGEPANRTRPAVQRGVVMIEGMPDTVELRLMEAPDDFPLGFSTYVPADMEAQIERADGGHSVEFVANFGGVLNERAYIQFFFYPPGTTLALARTSVDAWLAGLNPEIDRTREVEPFPWAYEQTVFAYPHEQQRFVGSIALARRGDVVFHYIRHHPAEYGDGMAPRIAAILDEWVWEDGVELVNR